jgi:hypothetical protein
VKYLIIGDGKVARHFEHYFTLKNINSISWSRKRNSVEELQTFFNEVQVILLLIADSAIESFIRENPFLNQKPCVHFSGSLTTKHAWGAHPLNTFPAGRYSLDVYEKTFFVCEKSDWPFEKLFPALRNPVVYLSKEKKVLYHALCVMTGNFTSILWKKGFEEFEGQLDLGRNPLIPYLQTITNNLIQDSNHALTGPLARRDITMIEKHLEALEHDAFQNIYRAFVKAAGLEVSV